MSRLTPQAAAALLRDQDNLLILTHRRPDGDTTGCAAALCLTLRQLGRTAFLLRNPEMTETNAVYVTELWAPEGFAPDFVVSVDIAARSLFFPAAEAYFDRIGLAVDHHPSFEGFGAHQCVDPCSLAFGIPLAMSAAWAAMRLAMIPSLTSFKSGSRRCSAGVT